MTTQKSKGTALVTGASSGIGAELARILAEKGYDLILVARRKDRLDKLQKDLEKKHGVSIQVFALDLLRPQAIEKLYSAVREKNIAVDVLVNNAGFGMKGDVTDADPICLADMIQLNVTVLTLLSRYFGKDMQERGAGHILQISSVGAFQPSPYMSVYCATKAYVLSFGEAFSYELKPHGVHVTTVYPGVTETEFFDVANFNPPSLARNTGMSARQVAEISLNALFAGKVSVIPGAMNKLNSFLVGVLPRFLTTRVVGKMLKVMS